MAGDGRNGGPRDGQDEGGGRQRLPTRRPALTRALEHAGHRFTVTIGFDLTGQPREVFADGAKIGADVGHILSDACVVISLALQYGCPPSLLPRSLGRVPDPMAGEGACRPASVLGVVADVIAEAAP